MGLTKKHFDLCYSMCPSIFQVSEKHYLALVIKLLQWADSWHQLNPEIREKETGILSLFLSAQIQP